MAIVARIIFGVLAAVCMGLVLAMADLVHAADGSPMHRTDGIIARDCACTGCGAAATDCSCCCTPAYAHVEFTSGGVLYVYDVTLILSGGGTCNMAGAFDGTGDGGFYVEIAMACKDLNSAWNAGVYLFGGSGGVGLLQEILFVTGNGCWDGDWTWVGVQYPDGSSIESASMSISCNPLP